MQPLTSHTNPPLLGFAAYSGTGKTTLLTRLIPRLRAQGKRIGVVKHAHHRFDIDHPGKDSYELRKAGAEQMLIASRLRWALIVEQPGATPETAPDPQLEELLNRMDRAHLDLILVEGFKHVPFPKIELHRPELGNPLLFPNDASIIAVATNAPLPMHTQLPILPLDKPDEIAQFINNWVEQRRSP